MKIKVLKTTAAAKCARGVSSKDYIAGETYDIFDELAQVFISEGWGKAADKSEVKVEEKAIEKAPENKMFSEEIENKEVKKTKKKSK